MSRFPIGLVLPVGNFGEVQRLRELAEFAEREMLDAFYLEERPGERLDPYVVLADIAQRGTTMMLGVVQPLNGARAPSVLAKTLSGLNLCSRGRGSMAIGSLDDRNPLPPAEMAEALIVLRLMAENDETTFVGRHFAIERAWNTPRRASEHPTFVEIMPAISRAQWLHELANPDSLGDLFDEQHGHLLCETARSSLEELEALSIHLGTVLGASAPIGVVPGADTVAAVEAMVQLREAGFAGALCRIPELPDEDQLRELIVQVKAIRAD